MINLLFGLKKYRIFVSNMMSGFASVCNFLILIFLIYKLKNYEYALLIVFDSFANLMLKVRYV